MARKINNDYIISVLACADLFDTIINDKTNAIDNEFVFKFIKSQTSLSKLKIDKLKITPMSLNTMKNIADSYFDGGWNKLDKLRKLTIDTISKKIEHSNKPKKNTKHSIMSSLQNSKNKLIESHNSNLILLQAISYAINGFETISHAQPNTLNSKKALEFRNKVLSIIALNPTPYNTPPS